MNRMFDTLRDAWKNRKALGDGDKTRELSAFLPAALEIQETPPSPLARWLSRTIITLLVIGIVWALLGQVNIVASAQGKILPSSRTKVIQPLQKGIVKSILVKEGQRVTQGQPLIELDSTLTSADVNRLSQERENTRMKLGVNQALLERLQSEHTQETKIKAQDQVPKAVSDKSTLTDPDYERLLQAQWRQYLARKQTLISAVEAAEAEIAGTKIEVQKLQKTLPIVTKRAKITKGLYEKKYASETEYLQLEQERIQLAHQLREEQQRLKQLSATQRQAQQQILALQEETRSQILSEITEQRRAIAGLNEELIKASDTNQRQTLYAPVAGQVQELAVTTLGGVVTEAQPLMKIVPEEASLIVEAMIENKDIGFIETHMPAEIKVNAFPFTKYGVIDAEIASISDDAIVDEQRGLIFSTVLVMRQSVINIEGRAVKLMPGMEVTAEIKTGERRLVEYFLAPLLRHKQESLRER